MATDRTRRRVVFLVAALVGSWLIIGLLAVGYFNNGQRIMFRNVTGVGLTEEDVLSRRGQPDAVVTDATQFGKPPFSSFQVSARPMTSKVLVYFRFDHMITVYLDDEGQVVCTYWGQRKR